MIFLVLFFASRFSPKQIGFCKKQPVLANANQFSRKATGFRKKQSVFARTNLFALKATGFCQNKSVFAKSNRYSPKAAGFRQNKLLFAKTDRFSPKVLCINPDFCILREATCIPNLSICRKGIMRIHYLKTKTCFTGKLIVGVWQKTK